METLKKILTLCVVHQGDQILLGMKKRGFGKGYWNGFGGKVHSGESIEETAMREIKEEVGIVPESLEKHGILNFEFEGNPEIL
ncbi:MAG: NUDIX domain-containing protein [Candidatus Moranbacteria bacterium]|nr:NUDIX domain-containing protein [Candidatus Moranbacteria bacterium]